MKTLRQKWNECNINKRDDFRTVLPLQDTAVALTAAPA